ncbi:MAG: hypothetical protein ACRDWA_17365 [Acidimicrobiia bacterium]
MGKDVDDLSVLVLDQLEQLDAVDARHATLAFRCVRRIVAPLLLVLLRTLPGD